MAPQIDTLPGAVLRVDLAGRICDLNEAGRLLDRRFAPRENLFDLIDQSGQTKLESCLYPDTQFRETSGEFEACIDSRRFRLTVAEKPCADRSRFIQVTDITEYRALSERLAVSEQRYRSLFSQNPDAVCSLDREGRLVETNHATEDLTGYPRDQLCSYHWESIVDHSDRQAARESFEAALAGNPCSYLCKVTNRTGQKSVVQVTYIPIIVGDQVVGVFGVGRDKTARYRLEESRRLLQSCMAQIQDVIVITETTPLDEPGPRIIYVNEGVERMTGYRPQEVLGKTPRMFQGPDTDKEALGRIRRALEAHEPIKEVIVNYCKDGQPFWNEIEIVPIPSRRTGEKSYFAAVQRDITRTKQREAELRRSQEELRRLNRAQESILEHERRRIARDLHDELGQTLTALKLNMGVAVNEFREVSPAYARRLESLIGSVDGAVEKVREISSHLRPAMLDDLGFEAAAEWFLEKCAGRDDLEVHWHADPTGDGRARGEVATALFRILQECMTNISRHSNASTVIIDYLESDRHASLEIRDDGRGFDPGKVRKSGLGLVGIRERVAMLRGDLTVESAIGRGVRVSVELPLEMEVDD
ncbi:MULTISPECIES: PAS domain-containing sensor histidine kinase [Marinobacter]|uniref:PAS domain-containing sensor histidine kinase n=1 Tax=Marinobacter TaxID=2742 RepID=UPI001243A0E4|nr:MULTISPECIES: PAS domain-containing sensor histidine kinase [Marinobacter]MBL3558917.1 PAS domain S-box protein [Marinobacter sp. JB05H06]